MFKRTVQGVLTVVAFSQYCPAGFSGGTDPGEARRSNFRIINNRSDSEWGNGGGALMTFTAIDGVEVSGNIQPLQPRRGNAGVATRSSCDVAVGENVFPNAVEELRAESAVC